VTSSQAPSKVNACSKLQHAHKSALTETRSEETVVERKTRKSKTKAMKKFDRESLLQLLLNIDKKKKTQALKEFNPLLHQSRQV